MATITCPRCRRDVTKPEGVDHWLGICERCNRSVFEAIQPEEQENQYPAGYLDALTLLDNLDTEALLQQMGHPAR